MNDNEILEMDETLDFLEEEAELGMIDEDMGELYAFSLQTARRARLGSDWRCAADCRVVLSMERCGTVYPRASVLMSVHGEVWYCPCGGVVMSVHGVVWYCPCGGVVLSVHGVVWYCLSMG